MTILQIADAQIVREHADRERQRHARIIAEWEAAAPQRERRAREEAFMLGDADSSAFTPVACGNGSTGAGCPPGAQSRLPSKAVSPSPDRSPELPGGEG